MIVFLAWIGIAAFLLSIYIIIMWRRNRHRSRFRAKLTILFLLFVFIPTVPLTFFIANLLTRSADILLIPRVGDALNTSLETIKTQIEKRGIQFLQRYEKPADWSLDLLQKEDIHSIGLYRLEGDSVVHIHTLHLSTSSLFQNWTPQQESLRDALSTNRTSSLIPIGEKKVIAVYRILPDSVIAVAGYPVSQVILDAKNEIERAFGIYSTLSLLKETIIRKNLIWGLAVLLVIGLALLSIVTTRKLSQGISEPIQTLVKGMERVADGDLSLQVETRAKDEFRFLVDSFNKMIQDLNVSRQKLIQAERLAAWQEVARQISHEIKNSLTPISISLRRFRGHFAEKDLHPNVSESLQAVEDELRSLAVMAAEFSDFARMPQPQKSPLELNEVVQSVVRLTEPAIGQVKIEMNLSTPLPSINADREQMKRLLNNLIKNAVEASHDTGTVVVTTRRTESVSNRVELEIRDQGDGMDKETMEKIFHPYYTTKKKGTGLGLAIVQKIVEDHNGEITIESQRGMGTRVKVRL